MAFQAAVAIWFAAHLLARMPIGGRFGLNNAAIPISIRLETGEGLDDIEVTLSDGGTIHVQCKTNANLSKSESGPLAKTIGQQALWVARASGASNSPDRTKTGGLLAVRADASRALDNLEAGCRAFDLGGDWAITLAQRNQAEREALGVFEALAKPAWLAQRGVDPSGTELATLARLFHVARFSMDEGDQDWREASRLLGRHLFGIESAGDAPLRDLKGVLRDLIGNGAPADRAGLVHALRQRGHQDVGAPGFEADVARLRAVTTEELARLEKHGRLPLGTGVRVTRASDAPLASAISSGSLLVTGEPGAGKTGALVHAAEAILASGGAVVFLSVDRFPGVAIAADLSSELGLQRPLIETLAAVPGAGAKVLFVDALDAARGGPSEAVFATLIEAVRKDLVEWTVVASIRTFDLKNGRRYRDAFAGTPAGSDHADPGLPAVRHFQIHRLSDADLAAVGAASPAMATLLASAPSQLRALLTNVFNLSLAAQLLSDGADVPALGLIATQSGLIDLYEDDRLGTTALVQAVAKAAQTMVSRRRLSVRKVLIDHTSVDAAIQTGVLVATGDLVSFAHHVLFDHVAGRHLLEWDDPAALIQQLRGESSTALLLAPALRFAIERVWRNDSAGRPVTWQLLTDIFAGDRVDPVLGHVALRVVVENIEGEVDIGSLLPRIMASPTDRVLVTLLGLLSRFVAMEVEGSRTIAASRAIVWVRLADALLATRERTLLDPARFLLQTLFEHADLADAALLQIYGRAARALLQTAWSAERQLTHLNTVAIRFVGKSFASDATASRVLLDRILREPRFSQYADQEAGWLAEQIEPITRADPSFAVEIYGALYGQTITDDASTSLGGQASRILPLTSNRRQDYAHALWRLGTAMGDVLNISPEFGTRALIEGLIGKHERDGYRGTGEPELVTIGSHQIELRGRKFEFQSWDDDGDRVNRDDDILRRYVEFLRTCDLAAFTSSVAAASRGYATAAVWTRIFGVGGERVAETALLLWPLLACPDFLGVRGAAPAAARFAALAWPSRTYEQRVEFEQMILGRRSVGDETAQSRWDGTLKVFFNVVQENALELEETRELRRTLFAEGTFSDGGNLYSATITEGDPFDLVRNRLRRDGVDANSGYNQIVHDISKTLSERLGQTPQGSPRASLAVLWTDILMLVQQLDASTELHEQVDMSAWGHISNAVERITSSATYEPGIDGLPTLPEIFLLLDRLSVSPYPRSTPRGE
ncbi:hypothetical protein [Variovorax sp. YR752]|uniref:hypothetical protein n=1 Tax=Variovorax sp. YR752 TaxID=1884383 RepID=UPI001C545191|nr:hypothetical protein [Variovorax sp. YR752]